jgi:hypothetical protein
VVYLPPSAGAILFEFGGSIYFPPAAGEIGFNFTTGTPGMLGSSWGTTPVGGQAGLQGEQWNLIAPEVAGALLLETWASSAPTREGGIEQNRYDVIAAPVQGAVLGSLWETFTGQFMPGALHGVWATEGTPYGTAKLTQVWAAESLIRESAMVDQLWAVAPVRPQRAQSGDRWITEVPIAESALLAGLWEAAIPSSALAMLGDMWRWNMRAARAWSIRWGYLMRRAWSIDYEIGTARVRRAWTLSLPLNVRVRAAWSIAYAIEAVDRVRRAWSLRWSLIDSSSILVSSARTVTVRGLTIILQTADISMDEGEYAWQCSITLNDPAQIALFGPDEPFTMTLGSETYSFIRQEPQFSWNSQVDINTVISGISPSAMLAEPRAEKVTKSWDTPTLASAILVELLGSMSVEVLDWTIGAKRLGATAQTPLDIAQQVAHATGGLVESEIDGSLYVRYAYPVPVPEFAVATPDHVYDDQRDVFSIHESLPLSRIANLIRILDQSAADGSALLTAEIDSRPQGFNLGKTQFIPGDNPTMLVFKTTDVDIDAVRQSAGRTSPLTPGTMQVDEALSFAETDAARIRYPAIAILSHKWLGNDLGEPELDTQMSIKVPTSGVGRLLISYSTAFLPYRLSNVPAVLNGETEYDVLAVVEGSQT